MKHTSGYRPVFEIAEWETLHIDGEVLDAIGSASEG